jgi:hypothetical protein
MLPHIQKRKALSSGKREKHPLSSEEGAFLFLCILQHVR